MPVNQTETPDLPIPIQAGLSLAAVILAASCVLLSVYVGVQSLAIQLPAFGIWYFLPVVVLAIVLGMLASRTAQGVAAAALGVVALLICMGFIVADRVYGPDIRAQLKSAAAPQMKLDQMKLEQLLKMSVPPATRPAP